MGASGWMSRVDYRTDIGAALEEARQVALRDGDYLAMWKPGMLPWLPDGFTDEDWDSEAERIAFSPDSDRLLQIIERLRRGEEPETPDDLLLFAEDTQTHSVIDIAGGVADGPDWGVASPFHRDALERTLGTSQPTSARVEEHANDLMVQIPRGQARFIIAYRDDSPTDIFFLGVTGD